MHSCQPRASGRRRQRAGKAEVPGADAGGRGQRIPMPVREKLVWMEGQSQTKGTDKEKTCKAERWGEHCDQAGLGVPKGSPGLVFHPPHIHRGPAQSLT